MAALSSLQRGVPVVCCNTTKRYSYRDCSQYMNWTELHALRTNRTSRPSFTAVNQYEVWSWRWRARPMNASRNWVDCSVQFSSEICCSRAFIAQGCHEHASSRRCALILSAKVERIQFSTETVKRQFSVADKGQFRSVQFMCCKQAFTISTKRYSHAVYWEPVLYVCRRQASSKMCRRLVPRYCSLGLDYWWHGDARMTAVRFRNLDFPTLTLPSSFHDRCLACITVSGPFIEQQPTRRNPSLCFMVDDVRHSAGEWITFNSCMWRTLRWTKCGF